MSSHHHQGKPARVALGVAVAAALLLPHRPARAEDRAVLIPVAFEGVQSPGTPAGSQYKSLFAAPIISPSGQVGFSATFVPAGGSESFGAWMGNPASVAPIALPGDPVPGRTDGLTFNLVSLRGIDGADHPLISGNAAGGVSGLWLGSPGGL